MPPTHNVPLTNDLRVYRVTKDGEDRQAHILKRGDGKVYVHYFDTDKRMDEWVSEDACMEEQLESKQPRQSGRKRKRGRQAESPSPGTSSSTGGRDGSTMPLENGVNEEPKEIVMTEEDYDIQHHKQITAQRNFDFVNFGDYQIKTWYFSPYPLLETEIEEIATNANVTNSHPRIPGVARTTARSHGRTSDMLAGGLQRHGGEKANLWVCDMCFKYMADALTLEIHKKVCTRKHPPGRKVYQRGAHTIWEVDGAKDKLYCQNLSLFGKLFIDVKTLFFDCDNFLFYILTDATPSTDHILGFFSKEKHSFDEYNLACIMTLPQYQRMGYGMLMIEFSYELSRRAGKAGTPERPLSDLGLRSYLAYWVATLIRFFRRVLSVLPPEAPAQLKSVGVFPDVAKALASEADENTNGNNNGNNLPKRKKRAKGFDGERDTDPGLGMYPLTFMTDPLFTTDRLFETSMQEDGAAVTHILVQCTLADIARATNLRVEDAAFALNECGLLEKRKGGTGMVLTRALVEKVAKERKVKQMCMNLAHVLLEP